MTEQEVRALVRDAIARHTGAGLGSSLPAVNTVPASFLRHSSHGTFALPTGVDTDGPCIIEPAVMCNHCGYCTSYGH